ncbi:MAG: alpha/beta fold hydrolase [Woeseiaceae bacterium]
MMWTTQLRSKSSKNITYYRRGSGLPLILIHGVGLKLESWNAQIQYLKKYFDVIAIDLPGHGESEILESRDINIDLYSEAIKSFTDEIIQKKFIIMGHSLGALIALDYIKKYKDDCYGLIALNCIYQRDNEAMNALKNRLKNSFSENFDKEVDTTIKRWFGEGESTENIELAKYCRSWLLNSNKTGYRSAYKVFANYKGVPKKLLMENILPSYFITGSQDKNSTPDMSRKMNELCENGNTLIVEGAGHMAQMSHFSQVNDAILTFALEIENWRNNT